MPSAAVMPSVEPQATSPDLSECVHSCVRVCVCAQTLSVAGTALVPPVLWCGGWTIINEHRSRGWISLDQANKTKTSVTHGSYFIPQSLHGPYTLSFFIFL